MHCSAFFQQKMLHSFAEQSNAMAWIILHFTIAKLGLTNMGEHSVAGGYRKETIFSLDSSPSIDPQLY